MNQNGLTEDLALGEEGIAADEYPYTHDISNNSIQKRVRFLPYYESNSEVKGEFK